MQSREIVMIIFGKGKSTGMERGEKVTYLVIYAALFLWVLELFVREWPKWLLCP